MKVLDFTTDSSFYKYVGPEVPFEDIYYTPVQLVPLVGDAVVDVLLTHNISSTPITIDARVLSPINLLADAFQRYFAIKMYIQSAFRSYERQQIVYENAPKHEYVALPGHSEHQTGFALDVINCQPSRTQYAQHFEWLAQNAHLFGFHICYQKGIEIDGYPAEPWHIRFLGQDLADYLYRNNMTFTQLYQQQKKT